MNPRHSPSEETHCSTLGPLDLTLPGTVDEVLGLQQAAYRAEAALLGFYDLPPLRDDGPSLLASDETFCGLFIDGRLAAMIAYRVEEGTLDIHRLAVHPARFRQGLARQLLLWVQAQPLHYGRMTVSTGRDNGPARALYEHMGFTLTGQQQTPEGLWIVTYTKTCPYQPR